MLSGKVCVVSGVGPGLGRAIAVGFAQQGADVVLTARSTESSNAVAEEIRSLGRRAVQVQADISDPQQCAEVAERALDEFGGIHVLVNNAHNSMPRATFDQGTVESWRPAMETNLWGSLWMTESLMSSLAASGDGRVIMISTMGTDRINPGFGAYTISKSALESATRVLARDLGKLGIRVNCVQPGYIFEEKARQSIADSAAARGMTYDELHTELCAETCLGYLPTAEDIAGTVVFLAGPMAKPITGECIAVNAGHVLSP